MFFSVWLVCTFWLTYSVQFRLNIRGIPLILSQQKVLLLKIIDIMIYSYEYIIFIRNMQHVLIRLPLWWPKMTCDKRNSFISSLLWWQIQNVCPVSRIFPCLIFKLPRAFCLSALWCYMKIVPWMLQTSRNCRVAARRLRLHMGYIL